VSWCEFCQSKNILYNHSLCTYALFIRFPVSNVHIALELDIVVNAGVKRSDRGYKISTIFLVT